MHSVARDHAIRGSLRLYLEHHSFVGLVGDGQRLRDETVGAGALEFLEPALRQCLICGGGREVNRRTRAGQCLRQRGTALVEGPPGVVLVAQGEQVECDEGGGCLLGQ
ncbi:Uncharacterised protein [Mycobacteroides abscessus subsp. abscessus]|nr:Uncharacterised protein [Mycobacteroides abscessus subsp. abscessus]